MTALELKHKQKELIQEINDDAGLLESALQYVRKLKRARQQKFLQFSVEEKENILLKGEQDAEKGLGTLHEDLEKEFTSW